MKIEELASKWASKYTHRSAPAESVWTFTNRTLVGFEKAIRAEVLEQAAKNLDDNRTDQGDGYDLGIKDSAEIVRAMKPQ